MVQGTGRPAGKRHTLGWAMAFCWSHKSPKPHAYALGPAESFLAQASLKLAWAVSLPLYSLW